MSRKAKRQAGFTLLEVLVSLVVLALIILGLSQGLKFGILALQRQSSVIDEHADLDAVDRTLRNIIEQIDPGTVHDAPEIRGNAETMEFASDLPFGAVPALPSREADIRLLVDGDHRLLLRWAAYSHATFVVPQPPTDTLLLQGVARIELSYWPRSGTPGWLQRWNRSELPALIRIRIIFVRTHSIQWPDIVAAPQRSRL